MVEEMAFRGLCIPWRRRCAGRGECEGSESFFLSLVRYGSAVGEAKLTAVLNGDLKSPVKFVDGRKSTPTQPERGRTATVPGADLTPFEGPVYDRETCRLRY